MTSCCQQHPMPWNGVTGAIARCKRVSTACGRKSRSVPVLHWICGVKRKPKAVNKPLHYFIVHGLDKPGSSATVSKKGKFQSNTYNTREEYSPYPSTNTSHTHIESFASFLRGRHPKTVMF